jgi:hypothetical protein
LRYLVIAVAINHQNATISCWNLLKASLGFPYNAQNNTNMKKLILGLSFFMFLFSAIFSGKIKQEIQKQKVLLTNLTQAIRDKIKTVIISNKAASYDPMKLKHIPQ